MSVAVLFVILNLFAFAALGLAAFFLRGDTQSPRERAVRAQAKRKEV
jgi:hypothetical protein